MKIIKVCLLTTLLYAFPVLSQTVYIPDVNFYEALLEVGVDSNNDSLISKQEAEQTKSLWLSRKDISDLTGINAFINLDTLVCRRNKLASIDLSQNTSLVYLDLFLNKLTSLDISQLTKLEVFHCDYNPLPKLDVSNNVLLYNFSCTGCDLTSLDVSNNLKLVELNCSSNDLINLKLPNTARIKKLLCDFNDILSLDLSGETSLQYLACRSNQLSKLDVSSNKELDTIHCDFNLLTSLDISENKSLQLLHCTSNQIKTLELNDTALISLYCYNNQLSELNVSQNTTLKNLDCSSNLLTDLDISNNQLLEYLNCNTNMLTNLNILKNTALSILNCSWNDILKLDVSENKFIKSLYCNQNQISDLDLSGLDSLEILNCSDNQLTALETNENVSLIEIYCIRNQITSLVLENNPALRLLSCSYNPLTIVDISNLTDFFLQDGTCGCGGYLDLMNIPKSCEICVWQTPFPPTDTVLTIFASPDLSFKDCAPPELTITTDAPNPTEAVDVVSSEDGMIYLVPENTERTIESIQQDSIKSATALAEETITIPLKEITNGVFWIYAVDMHSNVSNPKEITILRVGQEMDMKITVKMYPNPVESYLSLDLDASFTHTIKIVSLNGTFSQSLILNGGKNQIDLSHVASGVYIMQILSKGKVFTQKLIKL